MAAICKTETPYNSRAIFVCKYEAKCYGEDYCSKGAEQVGNALEKAAEIGEKAVGETMEVVHEYPDLTVHLTLFNATIAEGGPQELEHNDVRWATAGETCNYPFCPADTEILRRLADEHSCI